jgi:putative transcriptional regulator
MSAQRRVAGLLIAILAALAGVWTAPARGAELLESDTEAVVLVAKRRFHDPVYAETIVIARPIGQDVHVGFILNKPTEISLAQAFPDHGPSLKVRQPLYLGGPAEVDAVFALVAAHDSPGHGSVQLAEDLYLVIAKDTVDHVIEAQAGHARFFAGAVVWKPGELAHELKNGVWHVLEPDPQLVLPQETEDLWQRLVHRAELRDDGI